MRVNVTIVWYGRAMYGEVDSGIADLCILTMIPTLFVLGRSTRGVLCM